MTLVITDEAIPYLTVQRGAIHDLRLDRAAWTEAYLASIEKDFASMRPWLPERCNALLDVGSGLGGIDARLNQHYGGDVAVTLLDGIADPPIVESHSQPFNDMGVAERFLRANGVRVFDSYGPELGEPRLFDLIISIASWCFHFPPSTFLPFISACCHRETVLIIDVRRDKPEWLVELSEGMRARRPIAVNFARKFVRYAFLADA